MSDSIQKARTKIQRNDGDPHPTKPNLVWSAKANDWRTRKTNNSNPVAQKPKSPETPQQPQNNSVDNKPKSDSNASPKKQYIYKTKKPEVEIKLSKWAEESRKTGKRENRTYSEVRDTYTKLSDDKLLNILNSDKIPGERRHIAYEIASERNIPEDKINVSGKLQQLWDNQKRMQEELFSDEDVNDEEDEWETTDTGLGNFDAEEFMSKFGEDDKGWLDPEDYRVQKEFNGLKTLKDRQLYDNFVDHQKRLNPNYASAEKQLRRMKKGYFAFLSEGSERPMLVAAGGPGVGKTYNLRDVLEKYRNMKIYDEEEANEAHKAGKGYTDYDAVFAPQINSLPKLAKFLGQHPDKIIIFDDNDDLLTNTDMANVMKTIADGNPKNRFFPQYDDKGKATGKNSVFKGKMIILTNKSSDVLNKNADATAVMSRASKMEIKFTVQENIDALRDRYKEMNTGVEIPGISLSEEKQIREDIFNFIVEHKNRLDPAKFTVRKFIDVYEKIAQEKEAELIAKTSADAAADFEPEDWRETALEILNKAQNNELYNYDVAFYDPEEDWTEEQKEEFERISKKLDSESNDDFIDDEEPKEKPVRKKSKKNKIQKSLFDDMSLSEAEDLLLS